MRTVCPTIVVVLALTAGAASRADAQPAGGWEFSVVPLYFWASAIDGDLTAGPRTTPVFLKFSDAADKLGGTFSFHAEAAKGRWGMFSDLYFVRLSTSSTFTVLARTIEATFDLSNTIFEAGGSYLLNENK